MSDSESSEKTLFQKICDAEIPADIVYQDDICVCFRDIQPAAPTHLLLVPRCPIPRVGAATAEDASILGHMLTKVGQIATQAGITDSGYRVIMNHGADGGETVPHLHMHIIGGRPLTWPPG